MTIKDLVACITLATAAGAGALIAIQHTVGTGHSPIAGDQPVVASAEGAVAVRGEQMSPALNLLDGLERRLHLDMTKAQDLGTFGSDARTAINLFRAPEADANKECLVSNSVEVGPASTCLAGGLFSNLEVAYLVQSDGGPAASSLNYLHVVGVAAPRVDQLRIVDSSGSSHLLQLNSLNSFVYDAPLDAVHRGVVPKTLVVLSGGTAVATYPLANH
jgi:hypothetical protein